MSEVIPFDKRERNHVTGPAICTCCKHEWQAVISEKDFQDNDEWLQCPSCSTVKGRMKYPFQFCDSEWTCNCGNSLFKITVDYSYCPNCGRKQEFT